MERRRGRGAYCHEDAINAEVIRRQRLCNLVVEVKGHHDESKKQNSRDNDIPHPVNHLRAYQLATGAAAQTGNSN